MDSRLRGNDEVWVGGSARETGATPSASLRLRVTKS
jgi:hypothetical protein